MTTLIYFQYLENTGPGKHWIVRVPASWFELVFTMYLFKMTQGDFYLDDLKADMRWGDIEFGSEMVKLGEAFARASGLLGEELGLHQALEDLEDVEVIMEGTSNEVKASAVDIYKLAVPKSFRFLSMVFLCTD